MNEKDLVGGPQGPQMSPIERMVALIRFVPREYSFHNNVNGWVLQYPRFIQGQVVKIERSFQTVDAMMDFVRINETDLSKQQKGLSSIVTPQ